MALRQFEKVVNVSGVKYIRIPAKFAKKNGISNDSYMVLEMGESSLKFEVIQQ